MKTISFAALAVAACTMSLAVAAPTPTQLAYLKASNTGARDEFGRSVAISGDTVIVGALGEDSSATGVNGNHVPSGNDFVVIAAGWFQSLVLKSDGSMAGWGNFNGQPSLPWMPRPGTNFVAVAGGSEHSLALKSNGSLIAWGNNSFGQTSVPAGTNFVTISGGWRHSVAIQIQPPVLTLDQIENNVVLSWSTNHIGYTLDSRSDLNSQLGWSQIPALPTVTGGRYTVTNRVAGQNQFFRLRR